MALLKVQPTNQNVACLRSYQSQYTNKQEMTIKQFHYSSRLVPQDFVSSLIHFYTVSFVDN